MQHSFVPSLGADLRVARLGAGLSQAMLAQRARLCRASIVQVEAGRGRLVTLLAMAGALGAGGGGDEWAAADGAAIGIEFAAFRRGHGLTAVEAAARAGLRIDTVAAIEAGAVGVRICAVERLAAALGFPLKLGGQCLVRPQSAQPPENTMPSKPQ